MNTFVRLLKLPPSVRGMTVRDPDGNYNVYINQNLAHEMQEQTYFHEKAHIENRDFEKEEPVEVLESKELYKNR